MDTFFKCSRCGFLSFETNPSPHRTCPSCGWKTGDPIPETSLIKKILQRLGLSKFLWIAFFVEYFVFAGLIFGFIYHFYIYYPHYGTEPGSLAPEQPFQRLLLPPSTFEDRGAQITRVADFAEKGRVLSFAWRLPTDAFNQWAPMDLAIGWGFMSDKDNAIKYQIHHVAGIRTLSWADMPYEEGAVVNAHVANIHILPGDQNIARELHRIHIGDIVIIQGYLVDAVFPDRSFVNTSLSRTDEGMGACEVMWLTDLEILPQK